MNLSHLQFTDDTILFSSHKEKDIHNLFSCIKLFEEALGLNVNNHKSKLLGINCEADHITHLANMLGCKVSTWPSTYLGLPLFGKPKTASFWDPIIQKVDRRLMSWRHTHASKGGRLTLIQAALANLPIYFLSLFLIPNSAAEALESLREVFMGWQ